jgi:DNA topoisomerase I
MKQTKSTLIITEKPSAAAKIAHALSNGKDEKIVTKDKVSYYNFQRDGKDFLVGCAVGHLYGIQQIAARGPFPNYEVEWQPSFQKKNSAFTKKYLMTLKKLARESDDFIVATDFDREGEVIGWNVLRYLCKQKDAKRMKFSALTKDELENSFQNLLPSLEWGAAYAGETRHFIDWFYGINLSRGLMKALSKTGQFKILSIGRVQGPALKLLVDRERDIEKFIPTPYWQIFLQIKDLNNQKLEVKFPRDITNESELLKFQHLEGKKGEATTKIKEEDVAPPVPFDLSTLQSESYKMFKLTPAQTLSITQNLYTDGIVSYPRTSSQEYPVGIGYDKILKQLKKYTELTKYAENKTPTKGKKTDPAHPAIYPTGEIKKLSGSEKKIYDLIVKRFIACFAKPAKIESKRVVVDVNGLKFSKSGKVIIKKNWMNVYPTGIKEEEIPTIDGQVDITEIRTEEKMTQPPARFNPSSLVKELEKRNLGTKATRAQIVETLTTRGYAKGKVMVVTELGKQMEETLEKFAPLILDEKLTSEMEKEMEKIEVSDKDYEKQEQDLLDKAKKTINIIAKGFVKDMDKIGESLADANQKVWAEEKEQNTMTECPVCKEGKLRVMYGRKYKRYFVSCDAYPKCKTLYSLPPKGMMKPARMSRKAAEEAGKEEDALEMCQECGFPLVASFQRGKSPWKICFNPECKTNEEMMKKKKEFKAKLASGEIKIGKDGKVIDTTKIIDKATGKTTKKSTKKKTKKSTKKKAKKVTKK